MGLGLIFRVLLPWPTAHFISVAHAKNSSELGRSLAGFHCESLKVFVILGVSICGPGSKIFLLFCYFQDLKQEGQVDQDKVFSKQIKQLWLLIFRGTPGLYDLLCRYIIALIICRAL